MEAARTRYELAKSDYDIAVENLKSIQQGPSSSQIRGAQAEVKAAEAILVKAQHNLEVAQEILASATLRSPEDGVVVRVDLLPGMLANQGDVVMVIASGNESFSKHGSKRLIFGRSKRDNPLRSLAMYSQTGRIFFQQAKSFRYIPMG